MSTNDLAAQLARLDQRVTGHGEEIDALRLRIDGPPRNDSLSGRIHSLENDRAAANAAHAALKVAEEIRKEREDRRWTRGDKILASVVALIIALSPWIHAILYGN
jgi:hypothetical protein